MTQKAYESMSDEDFMNEVESESFGSTDTDNTETESDFETETDIDTDSDTDVDDDENSGEDGHADDDEDDETDTDSDQDEDVDGDTQDDSDSDSDSDDAEDNSGEAEELDDDVDADTENQDADSDTDDTEDDGDFDFKAGYEKVKAIFEPFKANGREMTVDNIDDARRLMQMGAGHTKFVSEIKPDLKLIKMLRENDLLSPEDINHMIDLKKKNPEAIARLVKESGISPMDIDTDKAEGYKPTNYEPSDSQVELDQAIEAIKGNDSYEKSISVMGEQWDVKSRATIAENPHIVGVIDDHIQSGVFDIVQGHVDKERALGRFNGVSDVDAYGQSVIALQENGTLAGAKQNNSDSGKEKSSDATKKTAALDKAVKKKREADRKKRKKGAAPTKGKSSSHAAEDDFSDLSDEEFEKKYGATQIV